MKRSHFEKIKSVRKEDFDKRCLHCGSALVNDYGNVTVPPLHTQLTDQEQGIKRTYRARRHFCSICNNVFDVIYINKVEDG